MTARLIILCFGLFALIGQSLAMAGAADRYVATREYLSAWIPDRMNERDVTGLSIAIVDDDRVVWARGFGYADKKQKVPAISETVYPAGLISNLFTATAAMQLVEQGRLDLDSPIQRYLPTFAIKSRFGEQDAITVRRLLTHHAGLPAILAKGMWTAHPEPFTAVLGHLREESLSYPPNTLFSYSSLDMTLVGHIVQNLAGRDFSAHLDETLLAPIGMRTAYFAPAGRGGAHDAKGYRDDKDVPITPLRDIPAGGLHASVADLAKFLRMIFADGRAEGRQILAPKTVKDMLRPQNGDVALDFDVRSGLGWLFGGLGNISIKGGGPLLHHGGAGPASHGHVLILPEHKLGVVVLANSASAQQVVDRVAVEALARALEAKAGIKQSLTARAEPPRPLPVDRSWASVAGQYTTVMGLAQVRRNGAALQAELNGRTFDLLPQYDGWLGIRYRFLGLVPWRFEALARYVIGLTRIAGRDVAVIGDGGQRQLVGERLAPRAVPPVWRQRVGRYDIVNLGEDLALFDETTLVEDDGRLILRSRILNRERIRETPVEPISDSQALLLGPLANAGDVVEAVKTADGELLRYSGYLFKRNAP